MQDRGRRVYGAAALAYGAIGLCWGALDGVWQSVPDGVPGKGLFAYAVATLLIIGGAGVQWARTEKLGGLVLAGVFSVLAAFWVTRIMLLPQVFATWSGCAEQVALAIAGILIFMRSRWTEDLARPNFLLACRVLFGICVACFGVSHFLALRQTAAMVPQWLPPGPAFWAVATGLAAVMAGLAIATGVRAAAAARLLTAMFGVFTALVWLPIVLAEPGSHVAWAGNAMNLALIGAAWVVANAISASRDGVAARRVVTM